MNQNRWNNRLCFLIIILITFASFQCGQDNEPPLIQIFHAPDSFSRRSQDFTANITGALSYKVRNARYRVNNTHWFDIRQDQKRVPPPYFTIELFAEQLYDGLNTVNIAASTQNEQVDTTVTLHFKYDPRPISFPVVVNWENAKLDVYDGHWEHILDRDGVWRVRPKPGFEDYDRILVVTGATLEGRRIETDMIFRYGNKRKPYGFGILPLWGGSPDKRGFSPRRGWNFGIAWYYSPEGGVGLSYSYKDGDSVPNSISKYHDFEIEQNIRYRVIVEAWSEQDADKQHLHYRQRLKWWKENDRPPSEWIELSDVGGALLPPGEFAVALIAHRCQIEFGPVVVKSLQNIIK
ncbi:MAG: hypothetical protein ACE5HI_06985 [bacterium]